MLNASTVLTIALMALTTYATRVVGYLILRNRVLGPRMKAVLDAVPGCVLIAVIAPAFVTPQPANLASLAITLLAATRLGLLPTVAIGVISAGLLRSL